MRRAAESVVDAAHRFVASLRPADSLGVSLFADAETLTQDLTANRDLANQAIDEYVSRGGTYAFISLIEQHKLLEQEGIKPTFVKHEKRPPMPV